MKEILKSSGRNSTKTPSVYSSSPSRDTHKRAHSLTGLSLFRERANSSLSLSREARADSATNLSLRSETSRTGSTSSANLERIRDTSIHFLNEHHVSPETSIKILGKANSTASKAAEEKGYDVERYTIEYLSAMNEMLLHRSQQSRRSPTSKGLTTEEITRMETLCTDKADANEKQLRIKDLVEKLASELIVLKSDLEIKEGSLSDGKEKKYKKGSISFLMEKIKELQKKITKIQNEELSFSDSGLSQDLQEIQQFLENRLSNQNQSYLERISNSAKTRLSYLSFIKEPIFSTNEIFSRTNGLLNKFSELREPTTPTLESRTASM
jgi:hypothetical protein